MTLKFNLAARLSRTAATEKPSVAHTQEGERLADQSAPAELEARFREALASGKITGDVISLDERGNVVKGTKSTNIFDL